MGNLRPGVSVTKWEGLTALPPFFVTVNPPRAVTSRDMSLRVTVSPPPHNPATENFMSTNENLALLRVEAYALALLLTLFVAVSTNGALVALVVVVAVPLLGARFGWALSSWLQQREASRALQAGARA